jgi:hypothetical protein
VGGIAGGCCTLQGRTAAATDAGQVGVGGGGVPGCIWVLVLGVVAVGVWMGGGVCQQHSQDVAIMVSRMAHSQANFWICVL